MQKLFSPSERQGRRKDRTCRYLPVSCNLLPVPRQLLLQAVLENRRLVDLVSVSDAQSLYVGYLGVSAAVMSLCAF